MTLRTPLFKHEKHGVPRRALADAGLGAFVGGVFALLAVGVGLGRGLVVAASVWLRGGTVHPPSADDAPAIIVYIGAFIVGGALLGLCKPLLQWPGASVVAGAVTGAAGMAAVATADAGGWNLLERSSLVIALSVGGGFGALVGLVWGSAERTEQEFADLDRRVDEIDSRVAAMRRRRERDQSRRRSRAPRPPGVETEPPPSNER